MGPEPSCRRLHETDLRAFRADVGVQVADAGPPVTQKHQILRAVSNLFERRGFLHDIGVLPVRTGLFVHTSAGELSCGASCQSEHHGVRRT